MKKIYISGRITSIEEQAAVLFQEAKKFLIDQGFEVINPMELDHDHGLSWAEYMRVDIKALCDCQYIYMLKNWKESKGAILEHLIATELEMLIIYEL